MTEDAEFCLENFLPEIEAATESIELSEAEKEELKGAMVGTVIKLLYAFLWQVRIFLETRLALFFLISFLVAGRISCYTTIVQ